MTGHPLRKYGPKRTTFGAGAVSQSRNEGETFDRDQCNGTEQFPLAAELTLRLGLLRTSGISAPTRKNAVGQDPGCRFSLQVIATPRLRPAPSHTRPCPSDGVYRQGPGAHAEPSPRLCILGGRNRFSLFPSTLKTRFAQSSQKIFVE